ncbi:helix-turn-helix transcriptional regulator [Alloscardovia omnicolens]|uniref:helix-turn-helix domain-containing protein n=1 Tax=Alloscardovia omnicolens TaxID=419015 RepID=UPI0025504771|nr:helix-turn-helix transcriptional regulator [Alloscardovia omnicolens]MDK6664340.1 helix-turn-helix transcriptional regulator [Alloscardovia omnicolens]MDK7748698.1 helix-turn-helix transcriptional regulator [Alloscardovia omnicolens]
MDTQIKMIMIAQELSQNTVEKATNIPNATLSNVYSGVSNVDSIGFLNGLKLAKALGVKPSELLSDESREELRKVRKAKQRQRSKRVTR